MAKRKYLKGDPRAENPEVFEGSLYDGQSDAQNAGRRRDESEAAYQERLRASQRSKIGISETIRDFTFGAVRAGASAVADASDRYVQQPVDRAKAGAYRGARAAAEAADRLLGSEHDDGISDTWSDKTQAFVESSRRKRTREGRAQASSESWAKREHWGFKEPPVRKPKPRPEWVPPSEHRAIDDMYKQMAKAEQQFMDGLSKSKLFEKDQKDTDMGIVSRQHKQFVSMMMFSAVQPLGQGVNASTIARCIGLSMMLWKLSPEFKQSVTQGTGAMKDALGDMTEKWAASKAGEYGAKGKLKKSEVWQSRLERIRQMRDGDRLPFTAESAALAEVALGDKAFKLMREPGADVESIRQKHEIAIDQLYKMADYDGISADELSRQTRIVVGQRLMDDPHQAAKYGDLAFGDFAMAGQSDKNGIRVWNGQFEHVSGAIIDGGTFSPRPPMGVVDHYNTMANSMLRDLESSHSVDEVHSKFVVYGLGWAGMPTNALINGMDRNNPARRRFETSMSMMQSMAEDGADWEQAQETYCSAFETAINEMEEKYPHIGQEWQAKYGGVWREEMMNLVKNPDAVEEFWQRANQTSQGDRPGPGPRGPYTGSERERSEPYARSTTPGTYSGPSHTGGEAGSEYGQGWSGATPSNEVAVLSPGLSNARRAEEAKRNVRFNASDGRRGPLAIGPGPDITGSGFSPPELDPPAPNPEADGPEP